MRRPVPIVAILRAEDQRHIVGVAGHIDTALALLIELADALHNRACLRCQICRTRPERAGGAYCDNHAVFITLDRDQTLTDFLLQGDRQLVFGNLGAACLFFGRALIGIFAFSFLL